jgi:hypothetical protein
LKDLDIAYDKKLKEIQNYKLSPIDSLFFQDQIKVFYYKARVHLLEDEDPDIKYINFDTVEEIPTFLTQKNFKQKNYDSDSSDEEYDEYEHNYNVSQYNSNNNFDFSSLNNIQGFENFNEIFNKQFGMNNNFQNNFKSSSVDATSNSYSEKILPDGTVIITEKTSSNKNGKIIETKKSYIKNKDGTTEPIDLTDINVINKILEL